MDDRRIDEFLSGLIDKIATEVSDKITDDVLQEAVMEYAKERVDYSRFVKGVDIPKAEWYTVVLSLIAREINNSPLGIYSGYILKRLNAITWSIDSWIEEYGLGLSLLNFTITDNQLEDIVEVPNDLRGLKEAIMEAIKALNKQIAARQVMQLAIESKLIGYHNLDNEEGRQSLLSAAFTTDEYMVRVNPLVQYPDSGYRKRCTDYEVILTGHKAAMLTVARVGVHYSNSEDNQYTLDIEADCNGKETLKASITTSNFASRDTANKIGQLVRDWLDSVSLLEYKG